LTAAAQSDRLAEALTLFFQVLSLANASVRKKIRDNNNIRSKGCSSVFHLPIKRCAVFFTIRAISIRFLRSPLHFSPPLSAPDSPLDVSETIKQTEQTRISRLCGPTDKRSHRDRHRRRFLCGGAWKTRWLFKNTSLDPESLWQSRF